MLRLKDKTLMCPIVKLLVQFEKLEVVVLHKPAIEGVDPKLEFAAAWTKLRGSVPVPELYFHLQ